MKLGVEAFLETTLLCNRLVVAVLAKVSCPQACGALTPPCCSSWPPTSFRSTAGLLVVSTCEAAVRRSVTRGGSARARLRMVHTCDQPRSYALAVGFVRTHGS